MWKKNKKQKNTDTNRKLYIQNFKQVWQIL